jgi:hypothetical protein
MMTAEAPFQTWFREFALATSAFDPLYKTDSE